MNGSPALTSIAAVLRSQPVRIAFLCLGIAAALAAMTTLRHQVRDGLSQVTVADLGATLCLSLLYLLCAAASWRAVLSDFGGGIAARRAFRIFFLSQICKYLPGGIFSFAAAAEMGHDAGLSRRSTLSALAVTIVLTLATGTALALLLLPLADPAALVHYWWIGFVVAAIVALVHPAVLRRLLTLARIETIGGLSWRSIATASGWATVGWITIGMQVWLLAGAIGAPLTFSTLTLATGGFALAWVAGFLVLVAPAGFGPREVTLTLVLASVLTPAEALVVALLSRAVITAAELMAAATCLVLTRR